MKAEDIKVGRTYEGAYWPKCPQWRRKVESIDAVNTSFRAESNPLLRKTTIAEFAAWAKRDVTEETKP